MTKRQQIAALDKFTLGYIEALLFCTTDESTPSGGEPLNKNYDIEDLTVTALNRIYSECRDFQKANEEDLYNSGLSDESAGHDFFLTRNRHGAGFWDRGLGETGEKLTEASRTYSETYCYVQRRKIHYY